MFLPTARFIAVFATTLFAGAAVYINVAEHPARMLGDPGAALRQWAPSYRRATRMQAPLALLGFVAGTAAWLLGGGTVWLLGGVLIGAVVPFTFLVIMPVNQALLEAHCDPGSEQTRRLLDRWARLHAVRSVLGVLAAVLLIGRLVAA